MPITVKGNMTAGETIIKTATPAVTPKNSIHEKLKQLQEKPVAVTEPIQKNESINESLSRQIPVKTNELVDNQKYRNIQEAELIKHYNVKSAYLADMINIDSD
jgi:hypothetical protein